MAFVGSADVMASLQWPSRCWGAGGQDLCAWDRNVRPVSEQQQLRPSCPGGFELPDELGLDSHPSGSLACGSGCMRVQAVAELGSGVRSQPMAKPLWHRGHPLVPAALSHLSPAWLWLQQLWAPQMLQWCPAWALGSGVSLVADVTCVPAWRHRVFKAPWRHRVFKAAQGKRKLNPFLPCGILSWFLL